jgi:hypothetical protein
MVVWSTSTRQPGEHRRQFMLWTRLLGRSISFAPAVYCRSYTLLKVINLLLAKKGIIPHLNTGRIGANTCSLRMDGKYVRWARSRSNRSDGNPTSTVFCTLASLTSFPAGDSIPTCTCLRYKVIQNYYHQMRKFGCNIPAVVQQYDIIKNSSVRGAMTSVTRRYYFS